HSEIGDVQQWKTVADINNYLKKFKQHSLRNPIVEQVVLETLRVVRDIWSYYGEGKEGFFNEIHVELGREMKNPADKRKKISERNAENEKTNYRIKEILKELMHDTTVEGDVRDYSPSQQEILKIYEEGVFQNPNVRYDKVKEDEIDKIRKNANPTKKEIQRYRLWLEQGYISPYTGKMIPLTKLFTTDYQIEHIIPQSRYFDDSLSNKVICESDVNENKSNKTAFEYLKENGGSIVLGHKLLTLEAYESHVNTYFKNNKAKLKNLLSEDIPEGFINRQLNDSRYISKLVKGLLSNIVREDGEREATSKNLIPVTGSVTSKLKHDWGLHDKWNEIVAPRFKRLNELKNTNEFGYWDSKINAFRIQVPDELSKGFSTKRIDHRHHALDALVVACTARNHTHYLSALNAENKNYGLRDKLLIKNENGKHTKTFQMPWQNFPTEAKKQIERIVVSFKQNLRVINKTNNKFWSYTDENGNLDLGKDGKPKKKLRKQTKGDNWAIRKPMHEETVSGIVNLPWVKLGKGEITTATRERNDLASVFKDAKTKDKAESKISKITDTGIQKILLNYLKNKDNNPELAFSPEGIEDMNKNIAQFNNGKFHYPIFKVRTYEKGKGRFALGTKGSKKSKYVQGAPNLFFAIYENKETGVRMFDTVPLNEVIEYQKLQYEQETPKEERTSIGKKNTLDDRGKEVEVNFLFALSPNDLVYIPNQDENIESLDFNNLSKDKRERLYNVNDFSSTCYFTPNRLAKAIIAKEVDMSYNEVKNKITGSFDMKTASLNGVQIKDVCIKLNVDRLGHITKVVK
ncbi:MAG: type II CRISPR RNA-guided endonuclease Cas9, partial [Flavobacteriaceae bacterium]